MSPQRDPRRWHLSNEALPGRLRQAIHVARSDLPSPDVLRSLEARVAPLWLESAAAAEASAVVAQSAGEVVGRAIAVGAGALDSRCAVEGGPGIRAMNAGNEDGRTRPVEEETSSIRRRPRGRRDPGARGPR